MPTIIDALVVSLNIDASGFKKGQDETTKALDETKRRADASAKQISESQSRAQSAFAGTGKHASRAADDIEKGSKRSQSAVRQLDTHVGAASKSIAEAGKTMLAPFTEFLATIGVATTAVGAIKSALSQAGADSAVARAASMAGIPVADFSTYGKASQLLGGDSSAAEATMASLAQQQAAASIGQISPAMMLLKQLGIAPNQPIPEINKELNRRLQGMPAARQSMILSQLGYDSGSAYLEERTPAVYDATMAKAAKDRITPTQAAAELAINKAYNGLLESVETLTRELTVEAAPALVKFARTMTDFVDGFQQSAIYKTFAAANSPDSAPGLNTVQTDMNKAGAWVHKWVSAALNYPSSGANPLPGVGPRGMRNNNPLNLKFHNQPGATEDSGGFAVFGSMEAGVSADYHQMLLDYGRGDNTINKLVPKWTTTDRTAYAATVLQQMRGYGYNISGDSPIDLTNPAVAQAMIASMSTAENGKSYWLPSPSSVGLSKRVTGVLAGLRSHGSYGGGIHNEQHINVTVHAPSGNAHDIAHVVKKELQKASTVSQNQVGGAQG